MSQKMSSRKAFTLTEICIVLGIIGLILGAAWFAASGVYKNFQMVKAINDVMLLEANVRRLYSGQAAPTNLALGNNNTWVDLSQIMIGNGVVPGDMVKGNTLVDPWGNPVALYAGGEDNQPFLMTYTNLTNDNCVAFASALIGNAKNGAIYSIMIDGTGWGTDQTTTPWSISQIISACNGNFNGNNLGYNFLQFTFPQFP